MSPGGRPPTPASPSPPGLVWRPCATPAGLPPPAAAPARGDVHKLAEEALLHPPGLSRALTIRAFLGLASPFQPGAMTDGAHFQALHFQLSFNPSHRLLECNGKAVTQVGPDAGFPCSGGGGSTAEERIKDVSETSEGVKALEAPSA